MKKILAVLLAMVMLMSFVACDDSENNADVNTTEAGQTEKEKNNEEIDVPAEEPKVEEPVEEKPIEEEPEELKEQDYDAMIDILIDAEEINSKIGDAVKAYNSRTADADQTLATLKTLQQEFSDVLTAFNDTEWQTKTYTEKAEQLGTALNGLNDFFTLIIDGLENEDYDKQDEAFDARQIYYDESDAVYEWFKEQ